MTDEDRAKWKRRGIFALALVVTHAGAFSAGRFSAPLEVQKVDKIVWKDRDESKTVSNEKKAKAKNRKVVTDTVKKPDGTVVTKRVETSDERVDTAKAVDGVTVTDRGGNSESTTTTTLRPKWRVSLQVGASYPKPLVPIAGPLVIGAEVDYRIYGGLTGGVWANTFGAGGVGLSMEF